MKLFLLLLLALSSASASALAEKSHFTTVFLDDEGVVYVGVKHGDPALSEIVSFPFKSGERTNIPLPAAIAGRDVIGLITQKPKLFVVTMPSGAPGKGDGPMLHVYDPRTHRWALVGKVACPTFTKVTLKPTRMIFSCEVGKSRKGKVRVARKAIPLRRERIYRNGVWRFPEFLLRFKGRTVLLEGMAPAWDKLHLRSDDGQRTISADDLLQLPLPAGGPEASAPHP
jgi:hypothetical protein